MGPCNAIVESKHLTFPNHHHVGWQPTASALGAPSSLRGEESSEGRERSDRGPTPGSQAAGWDSCGSWLAGSSALLTLVSTAPEEVRGQRQRAASLPRIAQGTTESSLELGDKTDLVSSQARFSNRDPKGKYVVVLSCALSWGSHTDAYSLGATGGKCVPRWSQWEWRVRDWFNWSVPGEKERENIKDGNGILALD